MSIVSSAIVWDHRGRTKKGSEGPLEYRITIDRKSWYINTGVKVCRNEWKFGAVINRPDSDVLNDRLRIISAKIETEINRCINNGVGIDVAEIREKVWRPLREEKAMDMTEWMMQRIAEMKIVRNSRLHYEAVVTKLNVCNMTTWSDLTVENIKKWDDMLRKLKSKRYKNEGSEDPATITDSTVSRYHNKLKMLINDAKKLGIVDNNPYDMWQPSIRKTRYDMVDYLSEEEIAKLLAYRPKGKAEQKAKDLFVFQCYTGLAYSDALRFDKSTYRLVNGKWISTVRRIKTGVPFVNVLLPPVVEVLERNNWKLPHIAIAWYNKTINKIGQKLGFSIRLRSHVARHTFATMMLRNGVKIENLARMLGHTNITQTQRYAKVLAVSVQEEFEMIEKKLFK